MRIYNTGDTEGNRRERIYLSITLLFFFVYFLVGIIVYDDYGMHVDDAIQRQHSLVNYKYINEVLFHRDIPALQGYPNLEEYEDKYGVAVQIPMVAFEDSHGFSLSSQTIYRLRHICCFFICFTGYIFFFLTLWKIFGNGSAVPLLGTMMIALYPRFFSIQFVDIKNMVFSAVCMVTIFFMVMSIDGNSRKWDIMFGCSAALACNVRMMGVIFPALWVLCCIVLGMVEHRKQLSESKRIIFLLAERFVLMAVSFCLFWYIITPLAWKHPVSTFIDTFTTFSDYTPWQGTMVFMGKLITCEEMPWYYLFVWFAITIPVYLLILFCIAHFCVIKESLENVVLKDTAVDAREGIWHRNKWFFISGAVFYGSVFAVIILHSRIYVGWHHVYYVFVPFCIMACFALDYLFRKTRLQKPVMAVLSALLIFQCVWMIHYHPFQSSYFNVIGKPVAAQFDREEWRLSSLNVFEWIVDNTQGDIKVACEDSTTYVKLLPDDEMNRIEFTYENPDFIVSFYRNVIGNDLSYDGYEEVYTVCVDGYKVASVFGRKTF